MIEINDDAAAADIYTKIDSTTGDERQQMADALITYGEKKAKEEYNQADDHFSNLFLDEKYYAEQVNTPELQQAYEATPFPKEAAKRSVLQGYLQHASGAPVSADTYEFIRDSYAQAKFGKTTVSDDEMFGLVRGEYDWQKQRAEAINDLQMQAVGKAITDSQLGQNRPFVDGMTEVFNQWQQKYPELVDGKNDAAFLSQGYKLYYDTINDLDTVRPQASKALSTLTSFTQGNATDEDMQSLANDFVGAPPEDRQKIYKYVTLAAQAGQIDRAGIEQFAVNMGQAFTRGFDFVPQGTLQMQEAGVNNWLESIRNGTQIWVPADGDLTKAVVGNAPAGAESDAWRQATVPEAETLIQSGQNVRESFKVVRELRNVAKTGVDPIRPVLEENSFWGTAERGAYGLSGSIPLMGATAVNPFLGVLAYQSTEYDRIMLENPDINPQFAQGLALVEGAANAAIDRVQLSSISGRLPMFGRYLDRIASDGVRRTVKIGANVVEQNLQEGAQDLIAPVLETAVAALREDMPDKDFTKLMDDWSVQRAETFFATLPLALIGGGVATYQDIKNPSAELNATKLRMAGFGKDQVTFIQRAENPEEYDARIQMEWEKRTPENIKAGEQEVLNTIEKARTLGELDARIERVTAPDGSEDIVVTSPDGKELLRTKSEQAALEAVRQHNEAQLLNGQFDTKYEPEELRQIINDRITNWKSQDSNNTLVMESEGMNAQQKLEQLQAAGNASQIQELHSRIANSHLKDTPYEQINILGEASVDDVSEMVFKSLITINPNTRPENLREEIHHTAVKVAIRNGSVTLDTLRGWLDATEKALPGTFQNLVRDSESDIVESLAQVQAAYEDGKIDANEASALPASFIDYIKNMMRTFAEVLRRAVALRGAFKDGALPAEYESFLAESVGLNQQTMVDTTRERVGGELAQGTFNYSVGQRVLTDTNPYPMEDKGKWWANEDFAQRGGQIVTMSPDEFLSQVRPLEVDDASRDNIDDLKNMMQSGRKLDPLAIYADGKEDGRHRAIAAKELGIDTLPVLDFRANKPEPKGNDFSIGSRASAVSTDTPSIRASNATITGPANYSIGAFHGTPHKVDKFSTEKIGTGEGAQAYGWGLYFAENEKVAKQYSEQVKNYSEIDGINQRMSDLAKIMQDDQLGYRQYKSETGRNAAREYDDLLLKRKAVSEKPGNLYSVELDVEPEYLLDWDKPLSEQPESVRDAITALIKERIPKEIADAQLNKLKTKGGSLYALISDSFGESAQGTPEKRASEALLAAGIPGIRYLDGGSRSEGQGTSNYVVFDENLIRITEENGNRIPAADAFAAPAPSATNYSIGKKQDADYLAAVERGDMQAAQKMADEAAKASGYSGSDHRMQHSAPDRESTALASIKTSGLLPNDYWEKPQFYQSMPEEQESFSVVRNALDRSEKYTSEGKDGGKLAKITVYRSVPKGIKEESIRNGDWVTPSKEYAALEGKSIPEGYKIISQKVSLKNLWWDGNSIAELGFDDGKDYAYKNTKNNRKLIDPVTYDDAGNVIPLSQRFNPRSADINYSIASQSEIDRVNRALGGMNRGPDERLKVYERAKQKFSKLMAWNSDELGAMADTGSDETQIRRNQLLQGFGELDAILKVLPPEVRGRVGGYTVLANIAPMDVFKDGVKVSEAKNMDGAIISAWMKEGQNIGQAGKQVSLPPGYTAKENLASKRADKALADFFRDRIKKIDTELEKVIAREYRTAILDLVKKSRPKAGDNNVRKSTLGPETQKLADLVQRATMMDEDAVAERMLQLEQTMATSENSADMVEEWGILNQFGDLKNRNSETLAQAYGWFKDQLKLGREAWRIKEEARIAENRERAKNTVAFIGKASRSDDFKNKTFMDRVSDWANSALLDHASFEQFVTALLPPDVAADFSTRLRKADVAAQKAEIDQREGILNALREGAKAAGITHGKAIVMLKTEVPSAVRYLDDRNVKNTKFTIEQAEKIVRGEIDRSDLSDADVRNLADELAALPADTRKENITIRQVVYPGKEVRLPMTRGKAIQLLLSWNQPDVQDKMRREGWTDDSITDLRELTSDPVSQAMISHAQELYGQGAGIVNPVYSRMFGMNMPQVKNYAPTRFKHSKDVKDIGLDGSPVATGTTPSFAKSRVSHSSEIAAEDALSVMQQHILMQAHWVNFAELAREYRSLINNPKVRDAIKNKHGEGVLKIAEQWADQMEQRGGNQAREAKWVSDILGSVIGGQSVASLGFNLKSIAMQLDNALRFGLALDKKQIASAMSSPDQLIKDIKTVFESDALQTRLRGGATAETRYMFERFGGKPGTAAKVTELSMKPMNWMDVSSFSFSAAIVYRANLNDALEAGMPESLARQTALDAAAAAIYRFSQPVSFGQKSNVENSGNMYTKAFFLFMSDPRLKAAIMADAVRGLATGRGDKWTHIRRLVAVELMAVLSHVVASSYRDAFTDDEDDDIWSYGGWVRAIALAPLQGYLFIGSVTDSILSQLSGAGWFAPTQNPLISVAQSGLRALKNADDILAFDDPDALFKEWIAIARTMAVAPAAAMPAVLLNLVKPIFGAADNATTED